jgi:hypothetical protein
MRAAREGAWAEREKYWETIVLELAGFAGDLRGLGAALPTIELLGLPSQVRGLGHPGAAIPIRLDATREPLHVEVQLVGNARK